MEIVSRLAQICPSLKYLTLSGMGDLTPDGQMSIVDLFIMIVQNRPPLTYLDLCYFNDNTVGSIEVGNLLLDAM